MKKGITLLYVLLVAFVIGVAGCTMLTVEEIEGILPGTWESADGARTYVFNADGTYTDTNNTANTTKTGRWTVEVGEGTLSQKTLKRCDDVTDNCDIDSVGITLLFSNSNRTMTILTTIYNKQ